jgi:phosphate transport system permease protein
MSAPAVDRPIKTSAVQSISLGRRIKNNVATTLFALSFAVALVPLIWVLWIVIKRGSYAIVQPGWWSHSLRGVLPEHFAGGVYHALYGTLVS